MLPGKGPGTVGITDEDGAYRVAVAVAVGSRKAGDGHGYIRTEDFPGAPGHAFRHGGGDRADASQELGIDPKG